MDALSEMEKNLNNKIKTAVQSVKVYLVNLTNFEEAWNCSSTEILLVGQTDRQTDWPTGRDRWTDRQTDWQTDRQGGTDGQTDWQTDRQGGTDGQTDWQTDRQGGTDGQTDWQTRKDRRTDRQTNRQTTFVCFCDFLGKRTLWDAYHKGYASHKSVFLDITETDRHWQTLTDWLTDRQTDRLTDWLTNTDWLTDWLTAR